MKATGIVRRIDDLGRVVIPKEIRLTMHLRNGDPLEIYTDRDGEVIFKKYSPIGEMSAFASQYAETLHRTCSLATVICDRDSVIACAGVPKKDFSDKKLSSELEEIISSRNFYRRSENEGHSVRAVDDADSHAVNCAMPIIASGDVVGVVASLVPTGSSAASPHDEAVETKLIQTAAVFLGRQLEE